MYVGNFVLPFVIGFLIKDEHVLLLKRKKEPWINKWNGAGGKIEEGENPTAAFVREVNEETDYVLDDPSNTRFAGIVTWDLGKIDEQIGGMFAYVSIVADQYTISYEERSTREGIVAWKSIDWTCDQNNNEVAGNIPYFLPAMLKIKQPMQYHCVFRNNKLKEVETYPLSKDFDRMKL